ncbi:MAG: ATP-binding protein [Salinivirgaceae bacterium]|nr:ATP-binding protein [Salinivirgaceae bacterium]
MDNPFVYGVATDNAHFIGREDEIKRLTMNFSNGINTILISQRRLGKTSLVNKVAEQMSDNKKLKIIRMDAFACKDESDFYMMFATEIIRQMSSKAESLIENAKRFLTSLVPKLSVEQTGEISFSLETTDKQYNADVLTLPERIAVEKGIHIVVCIDEFQQIGEFTDSLTFQKKLRSVWQHQHNTTYCLFGSKRHILMNMFGKASYPFYKFGDVIFLEKIPVGRWTEYIQRQFSLTGKSVSAEICEAICSYVESNSSYVQQLAWLLWARTDSVATETGLELAKLDLLRQNHILFLNYISNLSNYQMRVVQAIAEGHKTDLSTGEVIFDYRLNSTANVTRVKKALEEKEFIEITGKTVELSDPIFGRWVLQNLKTYI